MTVSATTTIFGGPAPVANHYSDNVAALAPVGQTLSVQRSKWQGQFQSQEPLKASQAEKKKSNKKDEKKEQAATEAEKLSAVLWRDRGDIASLDP